MNIVITNSKIQYKAKDGGVTRRIPEHFSKRTVFFEADGEERRIFITKEQLPREATEEEIIAYIENNFDESIAEDERYQEIQIAIAELGAESAMSAMETQMAIAELASLITGGEK